MLGRQASHEDEENRDEVRDVTPKRRQRDKRVERRRAPNVDDGQETEAYSE